MQTACVYNIILYRVYTALEPIHKNIIYKRVYTYYIIYYHEKPEVKTINQNCKWVWFLFFLIKAWRLKEGYPRAYNNIIRTWHVNTTLITVLIRGRREDR